MGAGSLHQNCELILEADQDGSTCNDALHYTADGMFSPRMCLADNHQSSLVHVICYKARTTQFPFLKAMRNCSSIAAPKTKA
jgi:hypothetical protein